MLTTLLDLQTHAGRWIDAEATLASAQKHRALEAREVRRRRALILFERAKGARRAGRAEEALGLAREAHAIEPGFVPATVLAGELLVDAGRGQRARGLLAEAWRRMPHPELARVFGQSLKEVKATERVERLQKLVESTSEHPESRLALAEALLRAGLWGLARGHLEALAESRPSAKAYRLMAELEEKEGGEAEAARAWLIKASAAPPDPAWVCEACGAASEAWAIHCPACEAFDALAWRQPPAIVRLRVEERAAARTQTPAGEGKGEAKARDEAPEKRPAAS